MANELRTERRRSWTLRVLGFPRAVTSTLRRPRRAVRRGFHDRDEERRFRAQVENWKSGARGGPW